MQYPISGLFRTSEMLLAYFHTQAVLNLAVSAITFYYWVRRCSLAKVHDEVLIQHKQCLNTNHHFKCPGQYNEQYNVVAWHLHEVIAPGKQGGHRQMVFLIVWLPQTWDSPEICLILFLPWRTLYSSWHFVICHWDPTLHVDCLQSWCNYCGCRCYREQILGHFSFWNDTYSSVPQIN